jgi:Tfp pilus assembly protein PilF
MRIQPILWVARQMFRLLESFTNVLYPWLGRTFGTTQGAMACARLSMEFSDLGRWKSAIRLGKMAVASDPLLAESYRSLGRAYHGAGAHELARATFEQGILLAPHDHRSFEHLGDLWLDVMKLDAAEDAYRKALALEPTALVLHHKVQRVERLRQRS